MALFDFLFRRGNPTNGWSRAPGLSLTAALDVPALNGVPLGGRADRLSDLGRSDADNDGLCCFDLGIALDLASDETLQGYSVVLLDEENRFQPYRGSLT